MGALAVLLWAQGVSADDLASSSQSVLREDAAAEAEPAPLPRRWYGWQIMLVDAASITAFVVGVQTEDSTGTALWASGLGAYLVGGPFVHVANDRHEHSDDSVGLRLGLPLGGAFVGGLVARRSSTVMAMGSVAGWPMRSAAGSVLSSVPRPQ